MKDLGNIRLSYADVNKNGTIEPATEILDETELARFAETKTIKAGRQNNYEPFGLKHKGYNEIANSSRSEAAEKYKFGDFGGKSVLSF